MQLANNSARVKHLGLFFLLSSINKSLCNIRWPYAIAMSRKFEMLSAKLGSKIEPSCLDCLGFPERLFEFSTPIFYVLKWCGVLSSNYMTIISLTSRARALHESQEFQINLIMGLVGNHNPRTYTSLQGHSKVIVSLISPVIHFSPLNMLASIISQDFTV